MCVCWALRLLAYIFGFDTLNTFPKSADRNQLLSVNENVHFPHAPTCFGIGFVTYEEYGYFMDIYFLSIESVKF